MEHTLILPGTGLSVSPFGLGCTRAGSAWTGERADRLLDYFVDMGGNVIDTARIYGLPDIGASEATLGSWLHRRGRRSDIVLMTKGGHPEVSSMHVSRMSRRDMELDLAASLRALRTDYVDIYFYHRDDEDQSVGELLECMEDFRRAGHIRFYACSNWSTRRMREADAYARAHGLTGFVGNECLYNLGSSGAGPLHDDTLVRADADMLAFHQGGTHNTMMPYSGLCEGFFHRLESSPSVQDARLTGSPYHTPANLRLAGRVALLREKYAATTSQVLAGFFFTSAVPMLPLFGCSSESHLAELLAAVDIPFTAQDYRLSPDA